MVSSKLRPRPPAMCGSETLAIDVSSSSMNVASVTVNATAHGFTCLALDEAGRDFNSAVVVATCVSSPVYGYAVRCILRPIGRKNGYANNKIHPGRSYPAAHRGAVGRGFQSARLLRHFYV